MKFEASDLGNLANRGGNRGRNNFGNNQGKNNKGGRNGRDRDNNRRSDRGSNNAILSAGMDFERGSGDRSFVEDVANDHEGAAENTMSKDVMIAEDAVTIFLENYQSACEDRGNQVGDVIRDQFWEVSKILTHYYEPAYEPIKAKLNKVLDVMCTQRFMTVLSDILLNEDVDGWNDGTNNIWKDVMFAISTTLITCYKSMKDETITGYIELLSSSGLAGNDIARLAKELGITKDLAVDLITAIPVIPDDMTDITLRQFYNSFVMKLMDHAEENIDVLDRGTQGKLFTFFFGKSKNALKAIGRMLAATKITTFANEAQKMIYAEYLSMLSDRLDAYEIGDIKYVLRFIVNEKKRRGKDEPMLFGSVSIAANDSIRKAEFEIIADDEDAKEYLVMS